MEQATDGPIRPKETTIGGHKFVMGMMDVWTSQAILHDLWGLIGPFLGEAMGAIDADDIAKSILKKEIDGKSIGLALSSLSRSMTVDKTRKIAEAITRVAYCDGEPLGEQFEAVFIGKDGMLFEFIGWGLTVQYANFIGAIRTAIKAGKKKLAEKKAAEKAATSQTGSPSSGQSGES